MLVEFAQLVAAAAPAEVMDVSHWLLLDIMSVNGARGGRSSACILSSKHLASQSQVISEAALPERQTASQQVSQFRRGPPALRLARYHTRSQTQRGLPVSCVLMCVCCAGKHGRNERDPTLPTPLRKLSITCTLLISIYGTRPIPRYRNAHAAVRRRRSAMEDAQKLAKRHVCLRARSAPS